MSCFQNFCFSSDKWLECFQKSSCHMVRVDIGEDKSSPKLSFLTKWWRNCSGTNNFSKQRVGFRVPGIPALRGWCVHPGKLSFLLELFYWCVCLCMPMCVCRYCYGSFYIYNVITSCCYCWCIIRCSVGLAVQWYFFQQVQLKLSVLPQKRECNTQRTHFRKPGWILNSPTQYYIVSVPPPYLQRRKQTSGVLIQPPLSMLFPVLINLWCCVCVTCS